MRDRHRERDFRTELLNFITDSDHIYIGTRDSYNNHQAS